MKKNYLLALGWAPVRDKESYMNSKQNLKLDDTFVIYGDSYTLGSQCYMYRKTDIHRFHKWFEINTLDELIKEIDVMNLNETIDMLINSDRLLPKLLNSKSMCPPLVIEYPSKSTIGIDSHGQERYLMFFRNNLNECYNNYYGIN